MKVKNNYASHLGFGTMRLLPGEIGELPVGYGKKNPTVAFYITKKWLEVVEDDPVDKGDSAQAVNVGVNINTGDGDNGASTGGGTGNSAGGDDGTGGGYDAGAGESAGGGTQSKPISRMGKEELRALATELGVEYSDSDTNPTLVEKIKAAQKGNE